VRIVVLDGYTLNPGDNPWDAVEAFGGLTVYDRTPIPLRWLKPFRGRACGGSARRWAVAHPERQGPRHHPVAQPEDRHRDGRGFAGVQDRHCARTDRGGVASGDSGIDGVRPTAVENTRQERTGLRWMAGELTGDRKSWTEYTRLKCDSGRLRWLSELAVSPELSFQGRHDLRRPGGEKCSLEILGRPLFCQQQPLQKSLLLHIVGLQ